MGLKTILWGKNKLMLQPICTLLWQYNNRELMTTIIHKKANFVKEI